MLNNRLEVIDHEHALAPYLDFWRHRAATPLQSPEWLMAWWNAFKSPTSQLSVVIVRSESGQILGLVPWFSRHAWATGRSLRFLGSGRACSDFQTLLSEPGHEAEVGRLVGEWLLTAQSQVKWSLLELDGTTENDVAINTLVATLKQGRCIEHSIESENTWRLDLTGGWTGFLSRLSKTQRRQTRNLLNRFDKSQELTLRVVGDLDGLPAALATCIDLHQRRWTSIGQPGCFADVRFTRFIEQACEQLATNRQVCISLLEENGVAIASQLFLHDAAGNQYMYQSGRDPDRNAENIGRMQNAAFVRAACETGVEFIDFLRGDEIYKGRLGAVPSKCLRRRVVAPAVLPRMRHGLWTLGRGVKHRVEALRQSWNRPAQQAAVACEPAESETGAVANGAVATFENA